MNGLHLFIDNSNLYIEGQRVARESMNYDDLLVMRFRINYGGLLDFVRKERKLAEAVLVGSRPPANDALWKRLEQLGIQPRVFDRSPYSGKEKSVDAELTNAIRDALEDNPTPGTVALVAGDRDYVPTLSRCVKKGWAVELYFWQQASVELKKMTGVQFFDLGAAFNEISFLAKANP